MTISAPPALVDFVIPHANVGRNICRFVYLNDWQGEGDIRIATIFDLPEGVELLWDDVDPHTPDTRFQRQQFPSLLHAQDHITEHALTWAASYIPEPPEPFEPYYDYPIR